MDRALGLIKEKEDLLFKWNQVGLQQRSMDKLAIFQSVLQNINWAQLKNDVSFENVDFNEFNKNNISSREFKKYIDDNFGENLSGDELY